MLIRPNAGFTLSELLISLALIGLIATFTIPKVLTTLQDQQQKALIRETVATLSTLTQKAIHENNISKQFFRDNLNYQKLCAVHPNEEGCWPGGVSGDAGNPDAYILHNGVMLTSFNGVLSTVSIDVNGMTGPNQYGQDQLFLYLCFAETGCASDMGGTGPKGPGSVGPQLGHSVSVSRFQWAFR